MYRNLFYLAIIFFFTFVSACTTDPEEDEILAASRQYASQNTDLQVELKVAEVEDDYARVTVTPANPEAADEAIMFLRKNKGRWEGITLGNGFTPDDYEHFGIPEGIRD